MEAPTPSAGGTPELTHEITIVRGQGRGGEYTPKIEVSMS